ncbi:MAG: 3'-5' exonuclease [Anaerolineales bacterium]|nr:3'-5' exonuclease [Anaerolineales bacterium]
MEKHREQAVRIARAMLAMDPIYIDTETTGFEDFDTLVEIAILNTDGSLLYQSLVKPNNSIPLGASRIHGITDATVAFAPNWKQVWPAVAAICKGRVAGFYNAEFDLRLLRQSCGLGGIPWQYPLADDFCVMELFARYFGTPGREPGQFRWHKLEFAGRYFNIPEPNAHRAKDDALLTKLVLEKIAAG